MKQPVSLIIGYGEVGKALHKVLGDAFWMDRHSSNFHTTENDLCICGGYDGCLKGCNCPTCIAPDVVHVCIPYTKDFSQEVKYWSGKLTIVHSSVPVGTCDKLGVVHSPIRGVHPNLEQGIRTFVKYFGGKNAKKAAKIFEDLGIKTKVYSDAKTTEALKLWDTTYYGKIIMFEKELYKWCKKNKIDFDTVYTEANKTYNEGYTELGMGHVVRPVLKHMPGKIGGHCVLPNAKLLKIKL